MADTMKVAYFYTESDALRDGILLTYDPYSIPQLGNCLACHRIGTYRFACCHDGSQITLFTANKTTKNLLYFNPMLVAALVGKLRNKAYAPKSVPAVFLDDQLHTMWFHSPLTSKTFFRSAKKCCSITLLKALRLMAEGQWQRLDKKTVRAVKDRLHMATLHL